MNFLSLFIVALFYFAKRNIWNFLVIFVLILITGLALYQSALDNGLVDGAWWASMWQNFATEMIGAILTFALFEMLINANNRQEELIRQMASRDNATAINAVNELRALGYLFDGTLQRKSLAQADLSGADLHHAKLINTNLSNINLADANLKNADLSGASLSGANLREADLSGVRFDNKTVLPNDEAWTSQSDLNRFTHPTEFQAASAPQETMPIILPDEPHNEPELDISHSRPQSHPYRALRAKRRVIR